MKITTALKAAVLTVMIAGCQQPGGGGSPFEMNPPIPFKQLTTNSAAVEMICYVDTEKYNPLNAKDYVFRASADAPQTQFFNHVVLAYAYLSRDERGYTRIELSPALRHILNNSKTFIKPLQLKGIKALIELRSGIYSDHEDGQGAGLGTMDMAAINEFTPELKILVGQYNIDGFYFNDVGGGARSYPPLTRRLKQFQSDKPLYPDDLFKDSNGKALSDAEVDAVLWREGGNNLSNLIQRANELLKEKWSFQIENGNPDTPVTSVEIQKVFLVSAKNHGDKLLYKIRDAYMPDAYAGANAIVTGNLEYIINDTPYDNARPHPSLWDEVLDREAGYESDDKYAPFTVDLSDQKDMAAARQWARIFLYKNPAEPLDASAFNQNRYGALFFTNLCPASENGGSDAYLTCFSQAMFGRITRLAETAGAGDNQKTW